MPPTGRCTDMLAARQRGYLSASSILGSGRRPRVGPARYSVITPENLAATSEVEGPDRAAILSARRVRRLEILVQLRKLYRNLIRGDSLLGEPTPVYKAEGASLAAGGVSLTEEEAADEAKRYIDEAVATVAEMQLTEEQLKSSLRKLNIGGFSSVFGGNGDEPEAAVKLVHDRVAEMADKLMRRADEEIGSLPFTSRAVAQAAVDARNARFRGAATRSMMEDEAEDAWDRQRSAAIERLEQAEKVAERIVSKNIPEAVQKVRELPAADLVAGARRSGAAAKGLWVRLNGGGKAGLDGALPLELPKPVSSKEERQGQVQQLQVDVDHLETKLQEASKVREARLRKVGPPGRARMASELREMDQEILLLTRALAVASLQLEMEAVYASLEDEALEIAPDAQGNGLRRAGTSDETALLAAEFALLDEGLAALRVAIDRGQVALIGEQELDHVAAEIPDMRSRLGIRDDQVFGGSGLSMIKMQLSIKESLAKVEDGIKFFARGIRLFGSDIANSGHLIVFAATGGVLKRREVVGLKRTVLDIATFFPFAIILIAPLTPVGHVLIFGFIQRYFPNLFPSQFTERRQALMSKYDQLRAELSQAQELASAEEQRRVVDAATEAISRLGEALNPAGLQSRAQRVVQAIAEPQISFDAAAKSAPGWSAGNGESSDEEGPAARAVRELERQLDAAERDALRSVDYNNDEVDTTMSESDAHRQS